MKLLPRLYRLDEGAIYVDNYDISKVELEACENKSNGPAGFTVIRRYDRGKHRT